MYLQVQDHSVSKEIFDLIWNEELEMLETTPQPSIDALPKYYQSEDYISHTDAQRNVFERLYHVIKGISLKRKLKLINQVSEKKGLLLDIGCGTGDFLHIAHKNGWRILGIEPHPAARGLANFKTNGFVFDSHQLEKCEAKSFDVITLWHVLEHLPNLFDQFAMFYKLLKEDGSLIIAVPNYKSYDAQVYNEFWAAYDVPRHLWHFSQHSIKALSEKFQMKVVEIKAMPFDAFYVSLLSEKYKTGRMNFFKGLWNGTRSNLQARKSGEYSSLIYVLKKQ